MSQTNTREGNLPATANEALTEGLLITLKNNAGLVAALPDSNTDETPFVLRDTVAAGERADLIPLMPSRNARVKLSGTCSPADQMVLATPNGTVDGMIVKLPAVAGTYRLIGLAEESGVDGQLVLIRPVGQRLITVT